MKRGWSLIGVAVAHQPFASDVFHNLRPPQPGALVAPGSGRCAIAAARSQLSTSTAPSFAVVTFHQSSSAPKPNRGSSVNGSNVTTTSQDNGTIKTLVVSPPTGNRFYRLFKL